MRNPHGDRGAEWQGDWCDDDVDKWTLRMKNMLKHEKRDDGIFWMDFLQFVENYAYLYICRLLEGGWKKETIRGTWKGKSAEGFRPDARFDFNPQYEITITRPCDGFICLR